MRWLCSGILAGAFLFSAGAWGGEWVVAKDEDAISVAKSSLADSPIKAFRATTRVRSSLSALMALFYDLDFAPEWIDRCTRVVALRRNDDRHEYTLLMETHMPWPVADRDVVIAGRWWQDPKTLTIYLQGGEADPAIYPENPNFVRSRHVKSNWTFRPVGNGMVEVTTEGHVDPAGHLPSWAVNVVLQESPFKTLRNLRDVIQDDRFQRAHMSGVQEPVR